MRRTAGSDLLETDAAFAKPTHSEQVRPGGPSHRSRLAASHRRLRCAHDDRPTLIACSGRIDSSALALALAATRQRFVIAHVVHDLRDAENAEADRSLAESLARALDMRFVIAEVAVRSLPGNDEANARRARYAELERLAREHGCSYVATGHPGDDQLETMLMAMLRGAGPRGLSAMRPRRKLGDGKTILIRPMLGITRADADRICAQAGFEPAYDSTNGDTSRLRAQLRETAVPMLLAARSQSASRLGGLSRMLRGAAAVVRDAAIALDESARTEATDDRRVYRRQSLAGARRIVATDMLRRARRQIVGKEGEGQLSQRMTDCVIDAIRDNNGAERRFAWQGVRITLDKSTVAVERSHPDA
ncbi:MAG: tRNA lysidine(34) synthetase TilS [Planctomycetota bacterium]